MRTFFATCKSVILADFCFKILGNQRKIKTFPDLLSRRQIKWNFSPPSFLHLFFASNRCICFASFFASVSHHFFATVMHLFCIISLNVPVFCFIFFCILYLLWKILDIFEIVYFFGVLIPQNGDWMLPNSQIATLFSLLYQSFRNCFSVILRKRIYWRHLKRIVMEPSIPQNWDWMLTNSQKATLFLLLWEGFRNCFFVILPKRIYWRHLKKLVIELLIPKNGDWILTNSEIATLFSLL